MQERINLYFSQLNKNKSIRANLRQAIFVLSFVVILGVFWGLKLTGITLAGEAFCGQPEHSHSNACEANGCTVSPHVHDASCYSNLHADLESPTDWLNALTPLSQSQSTADNVVAIATSQLGYGESRLNFQVDTAGIRRGITRYGQWYGNPYGDWSAMFVSFCLSYAGVEDLPANAGVESMRLEWIRAGLYRPEVQYAPRVGDLLFLTDDGQKACKVGIITAYDTSTVTVIAGDVDGRVAQVSYSLTGGQLLGYGTVPQKSALTILAATPEGARTVAKTIGYSQSMLTNGDSYLLYATSGDRYYAMDGYGNAVEVFIDSDGSIRSDIADPNMLLWTFVQNGSSYVIRNMGTGRHLHPFYNSDWDNGVNTSGGWTTSVISSGGGVKFRASAYAQLNESGGNFVMTRNEWDATVFRFGVAKNCTLWFDGTNGGIMSLGGSPNTAYTVMSGSTVKLPETWQSPDKYAYALRGWYDVINHRYYAPGEEITVTGNTVFYADWMAQTYDIGEFNSHVTSTVSTNHFVTTRMFDYGVLFNVLSQRANVSVSNSSHSEVWNLLTSGNNPYNGNPTLNFIFRDWDRGNEDISYPNGHNDRNNPTDAGTVYPGLYTDTLEQLLFDPELAVIGKQYLGQADHLFQLCLDPNDPNYGYYFYNSEKNAASYNQSDQRFYVYDYLECTRDSYNAENEGKYSDFLPLNSPYANNNDRLIHTYQYVGIDREFAGVTHYMYDSRYNDSGNTTDYVGANFWFGMSIEINFYLPHTPGSRLANGEYGNQDIYGGDMHFKFTGDDDVWVLVDGKLVLDLGGLHGRESGDINFSTGIVTINGVVNQALSNTLKTIQTGEHTLQLYYLERGSSMSNCAIYFNLAPRFQFSIQKEDVLTQELLNGAQFSVFKDKNCTIPAQLWTSSEAYYNGESPRNTFTVTNGSADMWGLISGETYYIKETRGPNASGYGCANGIICLTIDKDGIATYHVEVDEDADGQLSVGFTVHGIKIDEQTQKAFIVATNAPESITESTTVQVYKVWNDSKDHSGDYITVYLTVTDPDGTVRRIREVVLSKENDWQYLWENLPKYDAQGNLVIYGVSESTVPGYVSKVELAEPPPGGGGGGGSGGLTNAGSFENGGTYLLSTRFGYLAANNNQLSIISSPEEAQQSPYAQWVATVNGDGTVTLVNKAGQTFYYDNYTFKAGASPGAYKNLRFEHERLYCYIDHGGWSETQYPVDNDSVVNNLTYNHVLYTTNDPAQALRIQPQKLGSSEPEPTPPPTDGNAFRITNTPAGDAVTSLTVVKHWDTAGYGEETMYEALVVTIRLLANGKYSGLSCELSLKNGWTYTFANLPLFDSDGQPIAYSVEEAFLSDDWHVTYSPVISSGGSHPSYTVAVTNTYQKGGPVLPATGRAARKNLMVCGSILLIGSPLFGIASRRKRERRMKQAF